MRLMARTAPNLRDDMYCVIAIDRHGEIGAASMNSKQPLQYALWRNEAARFIPHRHFSDKRVGG